MTGEGWAVTSFQVKLFTHRPDEMAFDWQIRDAGFRMGQAAAMVLDGETQAIFEKWGQA